MPADDALHTLTSFDRGRSLRMPALKVVAQQKEGRTIEAPLGLRPVLVGTSAECDVVLSDGQASRRHCELALTERGISLRDRNSKNGTFVNGISILEAWIEPGCVVTAGTTTITVEPSGGPSVLPLSQEEGFGGALGRSVAMRALFAKLERAAPTEESVLLLGESGTGKEVLARAIHEKSRRAGGPLIVVDCGAVAPSLIESELFGHVKGAFTGADKARTGLFEGARGGTLFIDELGELPLDLQPKLLRVLEDKRFRRLGADEMIPFDARVVAATHKNLRAAAKEGSFRSDLYYRISVVEAYVPALRERADDIPLLVERFLQGRDPPRTLADLPPRALSLLAAYDWPGNVRELRNTVARLLLFPEALDDLFGSDPKPAASARGLDALLDLSLPDAREAVLEDLERAYVTAKLAKHGGNISRAAEAMGVTRQLLHRLLVKYDITAKARSGS